MGLDMYLTKHTYVQNWAFEKPGERYSITVTKGGKPVPETVINTSKIKEIVESVGYWRKANAIHAWFVEHVQDGVDDCKEYYVSREQLQELLDVVNTVLAASKLTPGTVTAGYTIEGGKGEPIREVPILESGQVLEDSSVAEEMLPTQSGFFFGNTEYNEWYFDDLKETKAILEAALQSEGGEFYYQSSW